jgi:hypothetical protein
MSVNSHGVAEEPDDAVVSLKIGIFINGSVRNSVSLKLDFKRPVLLTLSLSSPSN